MNECLFELFGCWGFYFMKHFCGGQVIYNREEGFFWCQCCGGKFDSIETLEKENLIAEQSDEQYEVEQSDAGKY